MKWTFREPAFGDMIRVKTGSVYHYGIFVSEDEVIAFGLPPTVRPAVREDEVEVLATDVDRFLDGGFLEVAELDRKERKKRLSPEETVARARERKGEKGYHLLYNNCEHFANECLMGVKRSLQADEAKKQYQLPSVAVYVAAIPQKGRVRRLYPRLRHTEVQNVSNERLRLQKYYVWKLLAFAIRDCFGVKMKRLTFEKELGGKWTTPLCEISLSHSHSAVAVALSHKPCGVDIELLVPPQRAKLTEKIFTAHELTEYSRLGDAEKADFFIRAWTRKESLFKKARLATFHPSEWESDTAGLYSTVVSLDGNDYYLSVASDDASTVGTVHNINLRK